MSQVEATNHAPTGLLSRRTLMQAAAAVAGMTAMMPGLVYAQDRDYGPDAPPSPIPNPM